MTQALSARTLNERDVNYLIEEGEVIIDDELSGRKMPGRRSWQGREKTGDRGSEMEK